MAGAGYKLFATGDVLTAAQVNTYLMQQTVMVFASSAARTSALSGVLAEGMVSYLQDTNTLEVYDGSGWVGATGDITGLTAGTGISISSATGPVPTVGIDTAVTADLTTAQTLTNKTLTNPVLTTPSISNINAKGDILVGTADNTLGVITAGANGESLVADSSTSSGLRYQSGYNGNAIINGGLDCWQRGTSFSSFVAVYTADRWLCNRQSAVTGLTISRQSSGLTGIQYSMRAQRDSGNTGTQDIYLQNSLESADSYRFAGQTVTVSFWAKAGANFSAASSNAFAFLYSGTGTDQNLFSGYTGNATVASSTAITLTTSWQRFSITGTVGSTATELGVRFGWTPTGTASTNDWMEITGVQLELGSVATSFKRAGGTLQGELAACQRYYQRITATIANAYIGNGFARNTTQSYCTIPFAVTMRTSPSALEQNGTAADYALLYLDTSSALNAVPSFASAAPSMILIGANVASGLTAGDGLVFRILTAGAYLGWSAEL